MNRLTTLRHAPIENVNDIALKDYYGPRRNKWYALPERHQERTPIDKAMVGKTVKVSRVIVRAGYLFTPTDVDDYALTESVVKSHCADQLRETVMYCIPLYLRDTIIGSEQFDPSIFRHALDLLEAAWGKAIYRNELYSARDRWMYAAYAQPEYSKYKHLRTFWYAPVEEKHDTVPLTGIKYRMCGIHYPPSGGHYDDYDPGGLYDVCRQGVYTANANFRMYDDYEIDMPVLIHPLDVISEV